MSENASDTSHIFNGQVTRTDGQETAPFRLQFSEDEWDRLMAFAAVVEAIEQCEIVSEGLLSALPVWVDFSGARPPIAPELPAEVSEAAVAHLLHAMRMVVLQKEATAFGRVKNIVSRATEDPDFLEWLGLVHDQFNGKRFGDLRIWPNDSGWEFTLERLEEFYMNGFEYHHDDVKREGLGEVTSVMPLDGVRALCVALMRDRAVAAVRLAKMIRSLRDRSECVLE